VVQKPAICKKKMDDRRVRHSCSRRGVGWKEGRSTAGGAGCRAGQGRFLWARGVAAGRSGLASGAHWHAPGGGDRWGGAGPGGKEDPPRTTRSARGCGGAKRLVWAYGVAAGRCGLAGGAGCRAGRGRAGVVSPGVRRCGGRRVFDDRGVTVRSGRGRAGGWVRLGARSWPGRTGSGAAIVWRSGRTALRRGDLRGGLLRPGGGRAWLAAKARVFCRG
jgi:hypothetical protein